MANSAGRMVCLGVGLAMTGLGGPVRAQVAMTDLLPTREQAMDVSADRVEYDPSGPYLIGRGNVRVQQGDRRITADYIQVNTQTEDAYARGNVRLYREEVPVWRGDELVYNLRTGVGDFGEFYLYLAPYQVRGERSEMEGPDAIRIEGVMLSPCEEEASREFRITASEARLREQRYLRLRHATAWLGPLPVLYSPYWWKDLEARGRWTIVPGVSSRLGAFLLTRYSVPLDERRTIRSRSHVNFYEHRGLGLGQDFRWDDAEAAVRGEVRAFGIRDQRLYHSEEQREAREFYLDDPARYRLSLRHNQGITLRDHFYLDATYLSDPYVQEDFLRREHRALPQPENRVALTHRADHFTASLAAFVRLNDFFDYHERLPEVQLNIPRLRLGDSPIFYQGEHSAVALRSVYPSSWDQDPFETARLDTSHRFLYPGRYLGFLSLTPRAELRLTHYSRTAGRPETVERTEWVFDEETETWSEELIEETVRTPGGPELRTVGEVGLEAFFKAFKVVHERPGPWGDGLRHIVEPYADYTFRPEPNLRPIELYDFDAVDRVDLNHSLRIGTRNKLQTRLERGILDIVDADVFTTLRLETIDDQGALGPLEADLRLRPGERFYFHFDAAYSFDDARVDRFHVRANLLAPDDSELELEYRFRPDERNALSATWTLRPGRAWSIEANQRFDLDEGKLAEHGYGFIRRHECVGWGVGVRHEPRFDPGERDEVRLWFQIWLLADPEAGFQVGG